MIELLRWISCKSFAMCFSKYSKDKRDIAFVNFKLLKKESQNFLDPKLLKKESQNFLDFLVLVKSRV